MGKSNNAVKTVIVVVILAALVGGYYFYLSNKAQNQEEVDITDVQNVILKDLEKSYPPTPKEVVKFYSQISKCLYNDQYTDEQFEQLADKMRELYDEELLEKNPRDQYLEDLKSDVESFKEAGYVFSNYTTSSSTDVEEAIVEGRECAKLYCTENIKSGANYSSTLKVYELRKEKETGHWKILGFELASSIEQ